MEKNVQPYPLTEIENILTYIGCIASSGKLPDVSAETITAFLEGNTYVFPDKSEIAIKNGKTVLLTGTDETIKLWKQNTDLIARMDYYISKARRSLFIAVSQEIEKLSQELEKVLETA